MSLGACQGIIFRVYPYSDTSLIFHCLTDAYGVVSVLAKGARSLKSSFAGKLDLFYLCRLELALSRKSDLHVLREASLVDSHRALRQNYELLCGASENARIVERLLEPGSAVPEVFRLFCDYLFYLPQHLSPTWGNLIFKIRLLALLGSLPSLTPLHLEERRMESVLSILKKDWKELVTLTPENADLLFLENLSQREFKRCQQ